MGIKLDKLDPEGRRLIEVAPGIEISRDIFPDMEFKPLIGEVETMSPAAFS